MFRDSCRREAQRREVVGWVANRDDGSVEAIFQGSPEAVDAMVEWCRHGPRHAVVEGVEVSEESTTDESGFSIV
ncbi:MAG: acylphosphatase [Microlunatus sp.]|nr:acylphosphatase [Microlunatus sp.]